MAPVRAARFRHILPQEPYVIRCASYVVLSSIAAQLKTCRKLATKRDCNSTDNPVVRRGCRSHRSEGVEIQAHLRAESSNGLISGGAMGPTRAHAAETASTKTATPNVHSNADLFMLTLCRVNVPVATQPPQSPHLRRFSFFTSRSRQPDGTERLYLHVGYFATLVEAQQWLKLVRGRYPQAIVASVPIALLPEPSSRIPVLQPADDLTDTQAIKVLEMRRVTPGQDNLSDSNCEQVALLRPDDTNVRRALKQAVVQGAPVSFAVQLQWSVEPIVPARVQSLSIFKAYTLYAAESRREGRTCHFLRLGFFKDAISAKQVAYYVRSSFASAAVVPVTEQECAAASEACIDLSALANQETAGGPAGAVESCKQTVRDQGATSSPNVSKRRAETLDQTLEMLAESDMWADSDSPSDTGVRHLQVTRV